MATRSGPGALMVALSVFAAGPSAVSAAGLVAAYGFEEGGGTTTADASGNANTAQLVGAVWTAAGKFGNALVFNGTNAWVTLVDDAPELRLTTAMTLEAWVKPSVVTGMWRDVIYKGNDNYFLEAASDHSSLPAGGGIFGDVNASTFGTAALPAGVWTHLATTYDGARVRLYVNGVQASSVARTGAIRTSAIPLQIGGDSYFGQWFAGTIDEVRVYDRALAPSEIQSDMVTPVAPPLVDSSSPSKPEGLTATAFSGTQINLSWTASTDDVGVTEYRVERCRGAGCTSFELVGAAPGPQHSDTGLALNTSYTYRVGAADAAGHVGPVSEVASATTLSTTSVPGLVAAYAFDEGAGTSVTDSSGGGNNGVISNATWTVAGRYGNALAFNGTNAWVTVNDSASLRLTTGMTLEAWVLPLSIPSKNCSTPNCPWMDVVHKETDCFYIEASSDLNQQPESGGIFASGKHIVFGPAPLATNAWTHLALTYDAAMVRFYVNGTLVAAGPETSPLTISTGPLRIGGDSVFGQYFNGTIDEVRVYNRALTAAEIAGDMSTPIGSGQAHPTPAIASLVPGTTVAGGPEFTLTVQGSGFYAGSSVQWNGADRTTTIVGPTELRAAIPAGDVAVGGVATVTVFNPPPVGGTSPAATFSICASLPEICNGIDDDCDGLIDDADPKLTNAIAWHRDADGDGHGDPGVNEAACVQPSGYVSDADDCDDTSSTVWSVPGEVRSVAFTDSTTLAWSPPVATGGSSPRYDTLRADTPTGFDVAACVASGTQDANVVDTAVPAEGTGFFYLLRAENTCGRGPLGAGTDGVPRLGRACP
jgi:concanavalin A-like lectin/glucanase superfamily protein